MANNGTITAAELVKSGAVQTQLAGDIITTAAEKAILNNPNVVRAFPGGDIEYKLAFMGAVGVESNVGEGQETAIETPEWAGQTVALTKDVVSVAISDEAVIRSQAQGLNVQQLLTNEASARLASLINKKIVEQLDITPQQGTSFNIRSTSIYEAIAEAQGKLPEEALITAIVCSRQAKVEIMSNLNKVAYGGQTANIAATGDTIPGLNIPVYASTAVESVDADSIYFISADVPGCAWFPGQVKMEMGRDIKTGVDLLRVSSWSAAKSNLKQTAANTNLGVVETTWTIQ